MKGVTMGAKSLREVTNQIADYCTNQAQLNQADLNGSYAFQAGLLQSWVAMLLLGLITLDEIRVKLERGKA